MLATKESVMSDMGLTPYGTPITEFNRDDYNTFSMPPLGRRFLRQVSEPNGIQSCFLTSFLNGGLERGRIKYTEARNAQNLIVANADEWFTKPGEYYDGTRVFNRSIHDLTMFIHNQYGRLLYYDEYNAHRFPDLRGFLRNVLAYGFSVVGNKGEHCVLAARYMETAALGERLLMIDPMSPTKARLSDIKAFAEDILKDPAGDFVVMK